MSKLALNGGKKIRTKKFPPYLPIGKEEFGLVKEVFKSAILSNAAGILMIHNHPSGNLAPSKEDIYITDRLRQAGEPLGIPLFDHIITGREKEYFSFQERSTLSGNSPHFVSDLEELRIHRMVAETDRVRE